MFSALKSFLHRRVYIDVSPTDLVLDVGSGDKPHWRADILLDAFPTEDFANQRIGGGAAIVDRWFVHGNVEKMPFQDQSFDYVICSHLLEHVQHPDIAIQELQRIARRGYIEVPFEGSQKLRDFPSHLWYIHKKNDSLIFTAKQKQNFDPYIDQLMQVMVDSNVWEPFALEHYDSCVVKINWEGQISYQIVGELSDTLLQEIQNTHLDMKSQPLLAEKLRSLFFSSIRKAYKVSNFKKNIKMDSILLCRNCGGTNFDEDSKGFMCNSCKQIVICTTQPYGD
jgi:SAM-dependent methyltransferase